MEGPLLVAAIVAIVLGTVWIAFKLIGKYAGAEARAHREQADEGLEAQERRRDLEGNRASARDILRRLRARAARRDSS